MRFASIAAFALTLAVAPAQTGVDDDLDARLVVETTLEQVRANPDAFKNVAVRFPIQFCSIGRVQNPFFTRFVPSQYANFYAWSAEQPIWRKESYDDLFGMLFLSKNNEQLQELYDQRLYNRLWCRGVVRNVFQGTPWIEVFEFEPMTKQVNTATLTHLYRAERHMTRRQWTRAIAELSLAPASDVPEHVTSAIHRDMGMCYLRLGEADQALAHLETATRLMKNVDRETLELARVAREEPETGLDRNIDRDGIGEADRPMWEAFAEAEEPTPQR